MKYFIFAIIVMSALLSCGPRHNQSKPSPLRAKTDLVCGFREQYAQEELVDIYADYDFKTQSGAYVTPTEEVPLAQWPALVDDLDFRNMQLAIDRQLHYYLGRDLTGTIQLGNDVYKLLAVKNSLQAFKNLLIAYNKCRLTQDYNTCYAHFENSVRAKFKLYQPKLTKEDPRFGEKDPVLFTAYYTPSLMVAHKKSQEYAYGVYRKPVGESLRKSPRDAIDFENKLKGRSLELFYAQDLFSLYLMHVQGSGRVAFEDNKASSPLYLTFSGTNAQPWVFISKYMLEKKLITDSSIESQKFFLDHNPSRRREVYSTCPSYVYFNSSTVPPTGSGGVAVTENRSIATDTRFYGFKGLLAFVQAERPIEDPAASSRCGEVIYKPFSRFYLDQDTGGAIRGKGRVDLYFGEGAYAQRAAYNIAKRGSLYFLMLK